MGWEGWAETRGLLGLAIGPIATCAVAAFPTESGRMRVGEVTALWSGAVEEVWWEHFGRSAGVRSVGWVRRVCLCGKVCC